MLLYSTAGGYLCYFKFTQSSTQTYIFITDIYLKDVILVLSCGAAGHSWPGTYCYFVMIKASLFRLIFLIYYTKAMCAIPGSRARH